MKKKRLKQKLSIGPIRYIWRLEIQKERKLSRYAQLVLICLMDHFNASDYRCDPGYTRIGLECDISRSTVRRTLIELVDKGVMEKEKTSYDSNQYNFPLLTEWMISKNKSVHFDEETLEKFRKVSEKLAEPEDDYHSD